MDKTHFHRGEHQIAEPHDAHEFRLSGLHLFHHPWVLHFEIPGRRWHFLGGALHDGTNTVVSQQLEDEVLPHIHTQAPK